MRRVLLKLSGEALAPGSMAGPGAAGEGSGFGIDPGTLENLAVEIGALVQAGGQLAVVLGGGNLFRGAALEAAGMDRVTADQMGMLATIMNGLAFKDLLTRTGIPVVLFSALPVPGIVPGFSRDAVVASLDAGEVTVLVGGTGNPFFTTDTAACLRAIEIGADGVLKATKVDGVYTADPFEDPEAERFDELSYDEVLSRRLGVMDLTAMCLCRDHDMPLVVFDMNTKGALTAIINGDKVGTRIAAGFPMTDA
ncbi:MAG: UMP kinase [Gammaproteobacteria bacterium]